MAAMRELRDALDGDAREAVTYGPEAGRSWTMRSPDGQMAVTRPAAAAALLMDDGWTPTGAVR